MDKLSDKETLRYSRHLLLKEVGLEGQLALKSATVAVVGAGGLGGTLFSAFQRFDYDFVAAILIIIIALIMFGEFLSNIVRRIFR